MDKTQVDKILTRKDQNCRSLPSCILYIVAPLNPATAQPEAPQTLVNSLVEWTISQNSQSNPCIHRGETGPRELLACHTITQFPSQVRLHRTKTYLVNSARKSVGPPQRSAPHLLKNWSRWFLGKWNQCSQSYSPGCHAGEEIKHINCEKQSPPGLGPTWSETPSKATEKYLSTLVLLHRQKVLTQR